MATRRIAAPPAAPAAPAAAPATPATPAGYSGTPLARKLGYRAATRAFVVDAPADYRQLLDPLPDGVVFETRAHAGTDLAHVFVTQREELARWLTRLRAQLSPQASLWVSWPKKASKRPTTVSEDTVRELALPIGLVDVKVCAVDATWSGLKLVLRRELR